MATPNCARCRHRRGIISENGFHYVCGLSWKKGERLYFRHKKTLLGITEVCMGV